MLVLSSFDRAGDESHFPEKETEPHRAERPLKVIGLEKAELGFELCPISEAGYFSVQL